MTKEKIVLRINMPKELNRIVICIKDNENTSDIVLEDYSGTITTEEVFNKIKKMLIPSKVGRPKKSKNVTLKTNSKTKKFGQRKK